MITTGTWEIYPPDVDGVPLLGRAAYFVIRQTADDGTTSVVTLDRDASLRVMLGIAGGPA